MNKESHIVHFFHSASEYCSFLRIICSKKFKLVARASYPKIYTSDRTCGIGYCEAYDGFYGQGWRVIIFRPRHKNNIVNYYIKGVIKP